jgi:hypothetical protein
MAMSSKLFLTATITALTSSLIAINHEFLYHRPSVVEKISGGREWEALQLEGAIGPESFAFHPLAGGPYAGISDGRVVRWEEHERRWINFSFASQERYYLYNAYLYFFFSILNGKDVLASAFQVYACCAYDYFNG